MYEIDPSDRRVVVYLRLGLGTAFRAAVQTMWWMFLGFVLGYAVHRAMTVLPPSY
jgi:urea transporter